MATMSPLRLTAYEWHGGGGSPLYSFASTGGVVHSEAHRGNLIHEIEGNLRYVTKEASSRWLAENDRDAEAGHLNALLSHVQNVEVGERIEDPSDAYE